MNIIEIINNYAQLLMADGREAANQFLTDIGCSREIREAVISAFPKDGLFCYVDGKPTPFSEVRFELDLGDKDEEEGGSLTVNVTNEGIILDAHPYDGRDSCTWGMMFDEWFEEVLKR